MRTWLSLALLAAAAGRTAADSFDAAAVPRDAVWAMHADFDRLRDTEAGDRIMDELTTPDAASRFTAFAGTFGFDPRLDLHALTVYSRTTNRWDAIALVRAAHDAAKLAELARAAPGYGAETHGRHAVLRWVEEREQRRAEAGAREPVPTFTCFYSNGVAVVAHDADRMREALDLLDRPPPGPPEDPFAALGPSRTGLVVRLAGQIRRSPTGDRLQSAILGESRRTVLGLGETAGRVRAEVLLETRDAPTAENVRKVVEGFVGLLLLKTEEQPQAAALVRDAKTSTDGARVRLVLEAPAAAVFDFVKSVRLGGPRRPPRPADAPPGPPAGAAP